MAKQDAVSTFIERLGLAAETEGLPRIAGRMLAFLLVEGRACRFDQLAEKLKVSRGSVSTNTRLLESFGYIRRVTIPGDRRDYFQINEDLGSRILEAAMTRLRRMQTIILETLPGIDKPTRKRLQNFADFYDFILPKAESTLRDWKNQKLK